RLIDLHPGHNIIRLEDLPDALDPSTLVIRPLSHPDQTSIRSISFEHGAASSPDALLKDAIGREVIINRKQPAAHDRLDRSDRPNPPETINARLLAFDDKVLVVETPNRQLPVDIIPRNEDIIEIKLRSREGQSMRPTLNTEIDAAQGGAERLEL